MQLDSLNYNPDILFLLESIGTYALRKSIRENMSEFFTISKLANLITQAKKLGLIEEKLIGTSPALYITDLGKSYYDRYKVYLEPSELPYFEPANHKNVQDIIESIGFNIGKYAKQEYEYLDVVWKDYETSTRLTHIFEVQFSGSVESALAKLALWYNEQRSKIFLVYSPENKEKILKYCNHNTPYKNLYKAITLIPIGAIYKLYNLLEEDISIKELFFD